MELMDHDEIVRELKLKHNLKCSIMEDQVGVFPITNCGIQTWLPLKLLTNSINVSRTSNLLVEQDSMTFHKPIGTYGQYTS